MSTRRETRRVPTALELPLPAARWSLIMTTLRLFAGLLLFLALCTVAWRRQPYLAVGMLLGLAVATVFVSLVRLDFHTIPIWLPPIPFAAVALTLFSFGIWAWRLGKRQDQERF